MIKDKHSAAWQTVKQFTEEKLAEMREENDRDLDPVETSKLRGRIEFAKEVLALEKAPEPKLEVANNSYID